MWLFAHLHPDAYIPEMPEYPPVTSMPEAVAHVARNQTSHRGPSNQQYAQNNPLPPPQCPHLRSAKLNPCKTRAAHAHQERSAPALPLPTYLRAGPHMLQNSCHPRLSTP